MSPATKEEYSKLTECKTKIEYLEVELKEIKQALADHVKEEKEKKERITDRRLAVYLALSSITGGLAVGLVLLVIQKLFGA